MSSKAGSCFYAFKCLFQHTRKEIFLKWVVIFLYALARLFAELHLLGAHLAQFLIFIIPIEIAKLFIL